jgi:hypothetical protein
MGKQFEMLARTGVAIFRVREKVRQSSRYQGFNIVDSWGIDPLDEQHLEIRGGSIDQSGGPDESELGLVCRPEKFPRFEGRFSGKEKTRNNCCVIHSVMLSCSIEGGLERVLDGHRDPHASSNGPICFQGGGSEMIGY